MLCARPPSFYLALPQPERLAFFPNFFPTAPKSTPPAVLRTTKAALAHVGHHLVQEEHLQAPPQRFQEPPRMHSPRTLFPFLGSVVQAPTANAEALALYEYFSRTRRCCRALPRTRWSTSAGRPLHAGLCRLAAASFSRLPVNLCSQASALKYTPTCLHEAHFVGLLFACKLLQAALCSQVSASRSLQKASAGRLAQADRCGKARIDRPLRTHICG